MRRFIAFNLFFLILMATSAHAESKCSELLNDSNVTTIISSPGWRYLQQSDVPLTKLFSKWSPTAHSLKAAQFLVENSIDSVKALVENYDGLKSISRIGAKRLEAIEKIVQHLASPEGQLELMYDFRRKQMARLGPFGPSEVELLYFSRAMAEVSSKLLASRGIEFEIRKISGAPDYQDSRFAVKYRWVWSIYIKRSAVKNQNHPQLRFLQAAYQRLDALYGGVRRANHVYFSIDRPRIVFDPMLELYSSATGSYEVDHNRIRLGIGSLLMHEFVDGMSDEPVLAHEKVHAELHALRTFKKVDPYGFIISGSDLFKNAGIYGKGFMGEEILAFSKQFEVSKSRSSYDRAKSMTEVCLRFINSAMQIIKGEGDGFLMNSRDSNTNLFLQVFLLGNGETLSVYMPEASMNTPEHEVRKTLLQKLSQSIAAIEHNLSKLEAMKAESLQ